MNKLAELLNQLFGLGSKAQLLILVGTHVLAVVVGIVLGITFAKPTIIINKDENQNNEGTVWGSDSIDSNSTLPSSSSNYTPWQDSQYRTQLLQFMPPSPSI